LFHNDLKALCWLAQYIAYQITAVFYSKLLIGCCFIGDCSYLLLFSWRVLLLDTVFQASVLIGCGFLGEYFYWLGENERNLPLPTTWFQQEGFSFKSNNYSRASVNENNLLVILFIYLFLYLTSLMVVNTVKAWPPMHRETMIFFLAVYSFEKYLN